MVNRMRHTRSHTANRRSHHALEKQTLSLCPDCGAPKMSHRMCLNCGKYKGKLIVDVQAALVRKEKKRQERNKALGISSETKEAATK
jgi:large subunit ribosomal protein L32